MINLSLQVVYQCLLELTRLHNNKCEERALTGYIDVQKVYIDVQNNQ